jgi:RNA polymerase sigma-70 factor (ECF subfamily)
MNRQLHTAEFPDSEWVDRLRSKDMALRDAASRRLRILLSANLRSPLVRRGLTEDCVEDVVQETLIRILDRMHTFRGDSRFMSWATAIGVRTGMELNRKQYWKTHTLGELVKDNDYNLVGPWQSDEPAPQAEIERREILSALSAAIQTVLTDRQRLVLLAEMKGMPITAIADELGATRGSVYKTTHDARKKLKAELERLGFDASVVIASINRE